MKRVSLFEIPFGDNIEEDMSLRLDFIRGENIIPEKEFELLFSSSVEEKETFLKKYLPSVLTANEVELSALIISDVILKSSENSEEYLAYLLDLYDVQCVGDLKVIAKRIQTNIFPVIQAKIYLGELVIALMGLDYLPALLRYCPRYTSSKYWHKALHRLNYQKKFGSIDEKSSASNKLMLLLKPLDSFYSHVKPAEEGWWQNLENYRELTEKISEIRKSSSVEQVKNFALKYPNYEDLSEALLNISISPHSLAAEIVFAENEDPHGKLKRNQSYVRKLRNVYKDVMILYPFLDHTKMNPKDISEVDHWEIFESWLQSQSNTEF